MYRPTLDEARALAFQGNLIPVYREVMADLETPVSAFLKIARGEHSFLLESVEGGERLARYSFIGTEPYRVLRTGPGGYQGDPLRAVDPLRAMEEELAPLQEVPVEGLPRFTRHFERLPSPTRDSLGLPEAAFMLVDSLLVFDHLLHKIKVVSHARLDGNLEAAYGQAVRRIDELVGRLRQPLAQPPIEWEEPAVQEAPLQANMSREEFIAKVRRAADYIVAGDIIQVVLALRLSRPTAASPLGIYRALRTINPSPYMYYLSLGDCHIIGASPELLVRVEEGQVTTHPIAGTRPRGRTPEEDRALDEELRTDEKERAEHIMLLDLGRNDIGRVSKPGTVRVPQLMQVERYSHVMHLVSHVTGELEEGLRPTDALRACFPAGTVSGAPKVRAMEIIAELEPERRGPYAGAVGYVSFSGNVDTAITIRTIVLKDGVAHIQAGAGIVYDSVPEREYQECLNKARALLVALDQAEAARSAEG